MLDMGAELDQWHASLPGWIQPTAEGDPSLVFSANKLFWRHSNLKIILYRRPFLERALKGLPLCSSREAGPSAEEHCAELCLENASNTIRAIHDFITRHRGSRLESWYAL